MSCLTQLRYATAGALVGNCLTGTIGFLLQQNVDSYRLPAAGCGFLLVAAWLWRERSSAH